MRPADLLFTKLLSYLSDMFFIFENLKLIFSTYSQNSYNKNVINRNIFNNKLITALAQNSSTEVNMHAITKTGLYSFDPLKPHFYIVKLGFTGVYIIFLISAQNIDYGYSLEPPQRGGSNEYPQSMF